MAGHHHHHHHNHHSAADMSDEESGLGYQNTLMYGRYTQDLGAAARNEARRLRRLDRRRKRDDKARQRELSAATPSKIGKVISFVWKNTFAKLGEDWIFLALLGIIMAVLSFIMDRGISMCNNARIWMYQDLASGILTKYLSWVSLSVCLILFSAGFVHIVAPQAIGSGIPEMKTILRGVSLKEYLTFKTLVAKVVGLTATLGSGMPLGKEGPFVHIASMVASLLSKLVTSFQGIYENESRTTEMLAAACAVGVGSCFAAPIGGVLFSIEVTTVYFAVRNYWRGFFAAVCSATVFRLLAVWTGGAHTVTAMFPTNFPMEFPFDPQELVVFALMGAISGLIGAGYVWLHRQYVIFMRSNKRMNQFLQKNRFLYPGIVSLLVASITFPMGLGQYIAGDLTTHDQVMSLFANFTWTSDNLAADEAEVLQHWSTPHAGVFVTLTSFIISTFFLTIVASTIPVPAGIFIPVFKIGAALGRLVGELVHNIFPMGLRYGGYVSPILPGGYACVGAAAVSGAVTHTVSVAVIVLEMTGQVTHVVPIVTAVLVANAVAALIQPSAYDSIILIKKLPYLPDLLTGNTGMYSMNVEDFMERNVKYIYNGITYQQLKDLLKENKGFRSFPLVDNPDSMILLGSVQRLELVRMIDKHVGRERRLQVAAKWQQEAAEKAKEEQKRKRRPSRFEVSPAPDILKLQTPQTLQHGSSMTTTDTAGLLPAPGVLFRPKSILKKTNSFTMMRPVIVSNSTATSPQTLLPPHPSVYSTVTGAESRIRMAFEAVFKKSTTLQDVNPDPENGVNSTQSDADSEYSPQPLMITQRSPSINKKVQLPGERVCDMSIAEQRAWEQAEMALPADFMKIGIGKVNEDNSSCKVDPAPFQLVEKTSLLKVHSLFSMVGIDKAYVTSIGKLMGVVGLKELRKAIEDVNSGIFTQPTVASDEEKPADSKNIEKPNPADTNISIVKEETLPLANNKHD